MFSIKYDYLRNIYTHFIKSSSVSNTLKLGMARVCLLYRLIYNGLWNNWFAKHNSSRKCDITKNWRRENYILGAYLYIRQPSTHAQNFTLWSFTLNFYCWKNFTPVRNVSCFFFFLNEKVLIFLRSARRGDNALNICTIHITLGATFLMG